jgi:putative ABC transport system ATP-binding protein
MNVYSCTNVHKTFCLGENTVSALKGIDLEVNAGEFIWISGTSGSGKSTLLSLLGLLDTPTTGEIICDNQSVNQLSEKEQDIIRRNKIGFVFQNFQLLPILTAYENVELSLELCGKKDPSLIESILQEVGLEHEMQRYPNQLSGGQQQRVAIARALVKEPLVILADEPTANLDSKTSLDILQLFHRLSSNNRHAVILSSHDELVQKFCSKEIHLQDGTIQFCKSHNSSF